MTRSLGSVLLLAVALSVSCSSDDDEGEAGAAANAGGMSASGGMGGAMGGASGAAGTTAGGAGGNMTAGAGGSGGTSVDAGVHDAASEDGGDADTDASSDAGDTPQAESPGGSAEPPPATWTEHWFEHEQTLQLVDANDWVVLYFDDDVDRDQTTWLLPFLTRVWKYTVTHYGQFTDGTRDGRLYAIYHQGKYSGGHPSTYFDASHDYRNVSDVGPGPFPDGDYGISTHEVSHIVEGASRGVHGSPAFSIWHDSKWAELFQYDLYVGLGLDDEANTIFDRFTNTSDDFPRAGTHWFRDWFYPLWRDHDGVQVMVRYFELLAEHFPKNGDSYSRDLNFGEYVHFMSGAAGTDLEAQATTAFGWPPEREAELLQARTDFPGITY